MDELSVKLQYLIDNMEGLILEMRSEDRYYNATGELFRIFHCIKSLSMHLKIETLIKASNSIEDILSIIRFKKPPILPEIIDWLLIISDHVKSWGENIERHEYDFIPIDSYTLNMVKTAVVFSKKPQELLMELDIFVCTKDKLLFEKFENGFGQKVKSISQIHNSKDFLKQSAEKRASVIIFDGKEDLHGQGVMIDLIKNEYPDVPLVLLLNKKITAKEKELFKDSNLQALLNIDSGINQIVSKLETIASKFYKNKKIKLLLAPTIKRIESIKPLPKIIDEIRSFEAKTSANLRELSSIITKDPLLCAKILKIVNSPMYPIKGEISSIHQAVTLLGRENIITLAMQSHLESEIEFDVSPYGITLGTFFEISKKRLALALKWYSKISMDKIGIITTAALLGNLGQILISSVLKKEKRENEFLKMLMDTNPMATEIEFLYTTTEDTTAELLEHWGMDKGMVDAIKYSNDLGNAPDDVKFLSIVLHVIFNTVTNCDPDVDETKMEEMADFLRELNFDPNLYLSAVSKI